MKFNDITLTTTPAKAARDALLKESIVIEENLSGYRLHEELQRVREEINILASKGGTEYARAILHKEVYEGALLEADLDDEGIEQAEVIIAAKAMNKKFQDMIEDVADMLGSDMITLVDQMKQRFGDGAGEQYAQNVKGALESAIDTLTATKDSLDSAITGLTNPSQIQPAGNELGAEAGAEEAPIYPSSTGPEEETTGREIKSELA